MSPTPAARRKLIYTLLWVALLAAGVYVVFVRFRFAPLTATDLLNDYNAATHLLQKQSIYTETNFHPPFDAILALPLALLPYPAAIWLWDALSLAAFFAFGVLAARGAGLVIPKHARWLVIGTGLCWYPLQAHLATGQFSVFIALLVTSAWLLLRQRRDAAAGALLGLAMLIKLFPGLLALWLLLRRRWLALAAMGVVFTAGMLFSQVAVGAEDFWRYFTEIAPQDVAEYAVYPINASLRGVFGRLFEPGPWVKPLADLPGLAAALTSISALALTILLIKQIGWRSANPKSGSPESEDVSYAMTCIAMLLLSPITWQHGLLILLLPFALLLANPRVRASQGALLLILSVFLLFSLPDVDIQNALMVYYSPDYMPWYAGLISALPALGMGLLWGLLTHYRSAQNG